MKEAQTLGNLFVEGAEPLQKSKKKKKGLHSNFVPLFSPKKRSSLRFRPFFRPKLSEEQKKKKGVFTRFYPISSPNVSKKRTQHILCVIKPNAQLAKGGGMPQFCSLFCAILQSWQTKGGPWPKAPPKYQRWSRGL